MITFDTHPDRYKHWKLAFDGPSPRSRWTCAKTPGCRQDYKLKLNSYDLGVDIELADAIQRLRFEHPEVHVVVVSSLKERIFCAGANIMMLRGSSHVAKVNFCKFTNETRLAIEDASAHSGLKFLAALNGICAGGGYELALACDDILLVDDGNSAVSLPEAPLLAVLPGTGGLTRVVDKRHVRRDLADFFSTLVEGVKGKRAVEWKLVDAIYPTSQFKAAVQKRARELAATSDRPASGPGIALNPLNPTVTDGSLKYSAVTLTINRDKRTADLTVQAPTGAQPSTPEEIVKAGDQFWPLRAFRELDDALLRLRVNEPEIGTIVIRTEGDGAAVRRARPDAARAPVALAGSRDHPLHEADAEARRPDLAHLLRVHRERIGVRRLAVRAGARRRSLLHVPRRQRGERHHAVADELRSVDDEQRPDAAADALPGRRGEDRGARGARPSRSTPPTPKKPAWSPSRPTKSTGTTKSASRSKRARRSRPTR